MKGATRTPQHRKVAAWFNKKKDIEALKAEYEKGRAEAQESLKAELDALGKDYLAKKRAILKKSVTEAWTVTADAVTKAMGAEEIETLAFDAFVPSLYKIIRNRFRRNGMDITLSLLVRYQTPTNVPGDLTWKIDKAARSVSFSDRWLIKSWTFVLTDIDIYELYEAVTLAVPEIIT